MVNSKKKIMFLLFLVIIISVIMGLCFWNNRKSLKRSTGDVHIESINDNEVAKGANYDLKPITVNEIFNKKDTQIIRGTVKTIDKKRISVGDIEDYRAILTINVQDVIRGDCKKNENIKILVPLCSIIATISDQIEVGDEGIFMPVKYDESGEKYYRISGNNKLVLKDVSDYGLLSGVYYLFIEKNGKIIFEEGIYKDLKNVKSLDEISDYIKEQIKN